MDENFLEFQKNQQLNDQQQINFENVKSVISYSQITQAKLCTFIY